MSDTHAVPVSADAFLEKAIHAVMADPGCVDEYVRRAFEDNYPGAPALAAAISAVAAAISAVAVD